MSTASVTAAAPRRRSLDLVRELTMSAILLAIVAVLAVGIATMDIPSNADFPGPRFFPIIIASLIAALALAQTVAVLRKWRSGALVPLGSDGEAGHRMADGDLPMEEPTRARLDRRALAWIVLSLLGFALTLEVLGWVIGAGLLFGCIARAFGSRRVLLDLVIGLTVSSLAYIGFSMLLGLSLPSGILGGGF